MPKDKLEVTLVIEKAQANWLADNASEYALEDESKAARVLLDYAMDGIETDIIFSAANMRCMHCG